MIMKRGATQVARHPRAMKHRFPILIVLLLATFGTAGFVRAADKPNILVILSDDQGYMDTGFQGCKDIPTPHLDRLARSGLRCTSGYVSHPFCSPTRDGHFLSAQQVDQRTLIQQVHLDFVVPVRVR